MKTEKSISSTGVICNARCPPAETHYIVYPMPYSAGQLTIISTSHSSSFSWLSVHKLEQVYLIRVGNSPLAHWLQSIDGHLALFLSFTPNPQTTTPFVSSGFFSRFSFVFVFFGGFSFAPISLSLDCVNLVNVLTFLQLKRHRVTGGHTGKRTDGLTDKRTDGLTDRGPSVWFTLLNPWHRASVLLIKSNVPEMCLPAANEYPQWIAVVDSQFLQLLPPLAAAREFLFYPPNVSLPHCGFHSIQMYIKIYMCIYLYI